MGKMNFARNRNEMLRVREGWLLRAEDGPAIAVRASRRNVRWITVPFRINHLVE